MIQLGMEVVLRLQPALRRMSGFGRAFTSNTGSGGAKKDGGNEVPKPRAAWEEREVSPEYFLHIVL
jgi:hypothetical protein